MKAKKTRRSKRIKSFPSFTIVESETSNSRYYHDVTYKRRWRQLQRMQFSLLSSKSFVRLLRLLSCIWALDLRLRKSLLNLNTIVSQVTLHNSACVMWGERRLSFVPGKNVRYYWFGEDIFFCSLIVILTTTAVFCIAESDLIFRCNDVRRKQKKIQKNCWNIFRIYF